MILLSGNTFGAQFDSVATDLLLAIGANIAGWVFVNNRLESQDGGIYLDGVTGKISAANGKILLNKDGSGNLANGNITWDSAGNIVFRGLMASKFYSLTRDNILDRNTYYYSFDLWAGLRRSNHYYANVTENNNILYLIGGDIDYEGVEVKIYVHKNSAYNLHVPTQMLINKTGANIDVLPGEMISLTYVRTNNTQGWYFTKV